MNFYGSKEVGRKLEGFGRKVFLEILYCSHFLYRKNPKEESLKTHSPTFPTKNIYNYS